MGAHVANMEHCDRSQISEHIKSQDRQSSAAQWIVYSQSHLTIHQALLITPQALLTTLLRRDAG